WIDRLREQEPNYEAQKVGLSTAVFFWLDLLKKDSPNFHQISGSVTASEVELFGGLSMIKPGLLVRTCQPGQPEDRHERLDLELGTIVQVCRASADYCERLNGGYAPAIQLPWAAQKQSDSERDEPQSTPTGAKTKPRGRSHMTRAIIGGLAYHPTAKGLELSEWLAEQGVKPTRSMKRIGCRSFAAAYRQHPRLRNKLDSTVSRIRHSMGQKWEL